MIFIKPINLPDAILHSMRHAPPFRYTAVVIFLLFAAFLPHSASGDGAKESVSGFFGYMNGGAAFEGHRDRDNTYGLVESNFKLSRHF